MTQSSALQSPFSRAAAWAFAHKFISGLIAIALISGVFGTVNALGSNTATTYVLATVGTGNVDQTVSGSGQIAASNEVDVEAKASGPITAVNVKVGDKVAAGQQLAAIDPGTAGLDLENAQLSYNDLVTVKPTDLQKAQDTASQAQDTLTGDYSSALSTITGSISSMTSILTSIHTLLGNSGYLSTANSNSFAANQRSQASDAYSAAYASLNTLTAEARSVTPGSDPATIVSVLSDAYTTANAVASAAKTTADAVSFLESQREDSSTAAATAAYTSASSAVTSANSAVSNVLSAQQAITNAKNALAEAQSSLNDTKTGPNASSVSAAALAIKQKQQAYDNYFVTAPFAGIVAKVDVKQGDNINTGTAVATVITPNKIATISLNEVDADKVKVGDKATLTFDAIDGLSLIGTVDEVDLVGTVTSGVVSYNATITLDTDDSRVKSGMSVDADIITDSAQNVVVVPNSAIKTLNGTSYVQVVDTPPASTASSTPATSTQNATQGVALATPPRMVPVTLGIADDTNTQVLSGLSVGETIVTRTVTGSAAKGASSATTGAASGNRTTTTRSTGAVFRGFGG